MLYFTMLIFVKEGQENVFQEFENLAIPLLKEHNGKIIYRIRPTKDNYISYEDELPYEIHFLSFNTEQDFKNFGKDERRKAFLHLKEASIKSTLLVKGEKI